VAAGYPTSHYPLAGALLAQLMLSAPRIAIGAARLETF
jgi:hypothetical protein